MNDKLARIIPLIGVDGLDRLKNKTVMICGVGGVGSFVAEALGRSGIGKLILIDFDKVEVSNLNRQLQTTKNSIGKTKVEVMKERINDISDCDVVAKELRIDESFKLEEKIDYLIDCVDDLNAKFILAKMAHENNIKHIAALGAAKRINPARMIYTNLMKTYNDPLAKRFREMVKKQHYKHKIKVVLCEQLPMNNNDDIVLSKQLGLGSCIMVTGTMGLKIAQIVFEELLED